MQALKKYFIPHEGNEHRPHILRRKVIAFVCLVALVGELAFILGTSFVVPRSSLFGMILVSTLTDETNSERSANDLSALQVNSLLQVAAQEKANDMATNGYFAHTSPTGKTPWYWFANVNYEFSYAGENLAINFSDSQDVTTAWMNSPKHRANILNGNYTQIGMATAQGEFNGRPAIYVVELFGTPAEGSPTVMARSTSSPTISVPIVIASDTATSANMSQTYIAVKGAETGTAPIAGSTKPTDETNVVQDAVASPRQTVNYLYLALIGIFTLALVLNIFIKKKKQHPRLIFGGVIVIAIAAICIVLNYHLTGGFIL